MASECIECYGKDTELYRGDDGHFRKQCNDCGYTGGPYVEEDVEQDKDGQTKIGAWT